MTAVTAPTTSRAGARDNPRVVAMAAAGAGRFDGPLKDRPILQTLQPVMVTCVLLNAAVATLGAAVAGELHASKTAVFVLGRRGPGRPLRSSRRWPRAALSCCS